MAQTPKLQGRILVVDNSRVVRAVVSVCLENAGYETDEAENGAEALKRLARGGYDVVITDLQMPELGGFDLLAAVKRMAPAVEVIILTGTYAHDIAAAVRALRLGAHDYLTKPPRNPEEVVLTVQRAVEKKRLQEANLRLLRELETQSRTDGLTGVLNRRAFDEALEKEVSRARRHDHPLGLLLLDVDRFKAVNDTHGHQAGDEALREVARTIGTLLRDGDALYRYGGEEFAVLLPETNLLGTMKAAQRIVTTVAGSPARTSAGPLAVTVSAGVACLALSDVGGSELLARADAALYEAKRSGRNRACANRPSLTLVRGGRRAAR